ncbi:Valine--tRNA ligase, partial [Bienertia sinuspersici]
QESKEIPKKSRSLRAKSLPDWPQNIDFDDKEEVLTIDAMGNTALVSGTILSIDVWSNNGVKYFVEFNDLCQPIRKGGHILIRFIGMMAKMETHCPVGEEDWHAIDSHIKGKIVKDIRDRFVIPDGAEYDKQALKRANKAWRQYKFSLKKEYNKPKEKTLDEMCSQEDEHGEKMSLLALWIKSHTGKDGSFLSGTDTNDFVPTKSQLELENEAFEEIMYQDEVPDCPVGYGLGVKKGDIYGVRGVLRKEGYGKIQRNIVEQLRLKYLTKSQLELENEAFEKIMYQDEIPDRPVGYRLGVKKGDIYGVRGVLRKEGYGKIQRNIVMDSFKEEMAALHKKNDKLEKEKEKLKDQVQENNFFVVSVVRLEKSSPELLNCTQELLEMAHQ